LLGEQLGGLLQLIVDRGGSCHMLVEVVTEDRTKGRAAFVLDSEMAQVPNEARYWA
jgi:hypothetical protein